MSLVIRQMENARLPGTASGSVPRLGPALAGVLAAGAAACGLLAWNLRAFLGRYDTLAYLLQDIHSLEITRIRSLLLLTGLALTALGAVAIFSWRLSLALSGAGLLLAGITAGPLVMAWLSPATGLEESMLYRLRGFSAIGVLGGSFLLFLSLIPTLLDHPASRLEKGISDRVRRGMRILQGAPVLRRRIALGLLAFVLATGVGLLVLQDFPNSSDENSYLTQARIFATGRLWVDAPARPDHFRARSFIMDEGQGRFFAKAFPGWAAILSLGVRAGAPWMVNPLLSAVTLVLAGWAGGRLLPRHGEWAVIGIILATPFFLLNAASYYNHPATLLLITLFLAAVIRLSEGAGVGWAILAGVSCAAALWVRPVPAVVLALPFGIWLGSKWARAGRWDRISAAAAPIVVALAGLAGYNRHMFGSIWRSGYGAYDPQDIQAGIGADHLAITAWWILKLCFWLVPGSIAGLWFLMSGRRWRDWFQREPILVLMLVSLATLVLSYLVYQNKGGNEYGPRYYYDGITYLAILMAAGWMRAPEALAGLVPAARVKRGAALALAFGACLTVAGSIPFLLYHYRDKVTHNRDLFTAVGQSGQSSALVFLATGSGRMPPGDLVRNPLDFRSGVVFARDLGLAEDRSLAALYPDRPALVYRYDPRSRRSTLSPLAEEVRP